MALGCRSPPHHVRTIRTSARKRKNRPSGTDTLNSEPLFMLLKKILLRVVALNM